MAEACFFVCALIYSFAVSIANNIFVLIFLFALSLLFSKKIPPLKLNIFNAVMIITLALTWPSMREGFMTGIIIALRVNVICMIFAKLISKLGIVGIYKALVTLKLPEKLRVLIILTLRGIYILRERFDSALISLRLRAPGLKGIMRFKTFAYILGSVLLQGSQRSERILKAINSRGGFGGFIQ